MPQVENKTRAVVEVTVYSADVPQAIADYARAELRSRGESIEASDLASVVPGKNYGSYVATFF